MNKVYFLIRIWEWNQNISLFRTIWLIFIVNTHEIYNLCDIDATSESRKIEKVDLSLFNQ